MIRCLLISSLLLIGYPTVAQNQWLWAHQAGGTDFDEGTCIATDPSGNVITGGTFSSDSIVFGSNKLRNASAGTPDIFLVKYNPAGQVQWAKRAGGNARDVINDVVTDAAGNIYITGSFKTTASFGTTSLVSSGYSDLFLAKYDPLGNLLFVRKIGDTGIEEGSVICLGDSGSIYIGGNFLDSILTIGTTVIAGKGDVDFLLARYDASGNLQWVKSAGGPDTDVPFDIAYSEGGIYVIGEFNSASMLFDSTLLARKGGWDGFFVKYDRNGNVRWSQGIAGRFDDAPISIAIDPAGQVIVTGNYHSDSLGIGGQFYTNAGNADLFLAKFDTSGNALWVNHAGGSDSDFGDAVCVDQQGNIYVGAYSYSLGFNINSLYISSYQKMLLIKFNASGIAQWSAGVGSGFSNHIFGIDCDASANLCVTGQFWSSISFGSYPLSSLGSGEIFIAKYGLLPSGIELIPSGASITAYPNPVQSTLTLAGLSSLHENIAVYSATGQCVLSLKAAGESNVVDFSTLAPGIYELVVISDKETRSTRIIKK